MKEVIQFTKATTGLFENAAASYPLISVDNTAIDYNSKPAELDCKLLKYILSPAAG